MSNVVENNSKTQVVKFQQGEETIMIHGYNNGKLSESSSVKGWKASLKKHNKESNRLYKSFRDPAKAYESWDSSTNPSQIALYGAMQKMQKKEENELKRSRRPDEWDSLYDQGRVKKVKAPATKQLSAPKNMSTLFDKAYQKKMKRSYDK